MGVGSRGLGKDKYGTGRTYGWVGVTSSLWDGEVPEKRCRSWSGGLDHGVVRTAMWRGVFFGSGLGRTHSGRPPGPGTSRGRGTKSPGVGSVGSDVSTLLPREREPLTVLDSSTGPLG